MTILICLGVCQVNSCEAFVLDSRSMQSQCQPACPINAATHDVITLEPNLDMLLSVLMCRGLLE